MLPGYACLPLWLALSSPAFASDAADVDAAILVTATRLAAPVDQVPASVTIIDKTAIDRAQDIGMTELLLRTPGVSMSRNGGYGTATSLRIRGAEAGQTVVVIDGVKLNDPSNADASYNFANLLIGDASRIEVLRGPQSILWGSQAIGGVVHVVTAMPGGPLEGSFDVEAGSRQTVSARAAVGGRNGPVAWRIGAQSFTTDGISAIAPAFGGREKDGYRNRAVQGRMAIALADNVRADLHAYHSRARTEFDDTAADSPAYALSREFVGYAGFTIDLFDRRFRSRFGYGYTETNRDNYDPRRARPQTFDANGRNERLEYQGSFTMSEKITALFGVEKETSRFRSVSPPGSLSAPVPAPARGQANLTGYYGQLSVQPLPGLTLSGGVRHDDHSRYGGETLFSAGGVWALPTGTIARLTYGEGFKAPTLYQLFSEYGNGVLAPERARGWEAGLEQHLFDRRFVAGASWFDRSAIQQIVYQSCSSAPDPLLCVQPGTTIARAGYYANVARAQAHGVEARAALSLGALTVDGNYSWTVAEDRSPGSAAFGKWLTRRPRHMANASIHYALPWGLDLGAAVRWSGKAYDNAANTIRFAPYALVDLRVEVDAGPMRLFARVENLFDKDYMTAWRYGAIGRGIHAGIRGRF
jgi:vitamin B12 transporter